MKLRKTRKNSVKLGNNGKIGQSETKHGITRSNKFKLGQKRWKVKTNLFKIGKKNKKKQNKTKETHRRWHGLLEGDGAFEEGDGAADEPVERQLGRALLGQLAVEVQTGRHLRRRHLRRLRRLSHRLLVGPGASEKISRSNSVGSPGLVIVQPL